MATGHTFNVVGIHCGGEVCDIVTSGVLDVRRPCSKRRIISGKSRTIYAAFHSTKLGGRPPCAVMLYCRNATHKPMQALSSWSTRSTRRMSEASTIATSTVLLETSMVSMPEPTTKMVLDAPAGLIAITADCEAAKVKAVEVENVPAFVYALDLDIHVPTFDSPVKGDIAWRGMWYALVDATSLGLHLHPANGRELVNIGERIKRAIQAQTDPAHPENPATRGVTILEFAEPLITSEAGKVATNTVVVSPGRLDRSPCGTGTCARLAVLRGRKQLAVGESFTHRSIIGTEFQGTVRRETKIGEYDPIVPAVKGTA